MKKRRTKWTRDCYVYALLDTRKPLDEPVRYMRRWFEYKPFYIGMGHADRMHQHARAVLRGKTTENPHKDRVIRKIIAAGLEVKGMKLHEGKTPKQAKGCEVTLISRIGRSNLTNQTDGGDGTVGHKQSKRTKSRISSAKKGKCIGPQSEEHRAKIGVANTGRKHSDEARAKMSTVLSSRVITWGDKISTTLLGRKKSKETRAKMSLAKQSCSEETRAKLSAAATAQWKDNRENHLISR